jgi:glycosyltransferase involved in cell wall biosynthesis
LKNKITYFVNDISFFKNHFLPVAIKAAEQFNVSIISDKVDLELEKTYPELKQYSILIKRSSVNPFSDLLLFFKLRKLLNQIKPDLIHNITIKPILYGSLFSKFSHRKIKTINSVTGLGYAITNNHLLIKTIMKSLIRLFVSKESYFLFLNRYDKKFYEDLGKVTAQNFKMIGGSGVDEKEFSFTQPIKKDKIEIVFTGRMLKDKGVIDLIKAMKLLDDASKKDVVLKLYGAVDIQNPAHIKEDELKSQLIEGFIKWEGFTSDVKRTLQSADIYCLPSYREGLPKSTIEAMAIGRPIITTTAPGCDDTVQDGLNGYKIDVGDISGLSKKLQTLIDNKELRIQMGKNSRELFLKNFTLEKVVFQTLEFYNSILSISC